MVTGVGVGVGDALGLGLGDGLGDGDGLGVAVPFWGIVAVPFWGIGLHTPFITKRSAFAQLVLSTTHSFWKPPPSIASLGTFEQV